MPTHTRLEPVWVRYNPRIPLLSLVGLSWQAELAHRRLCDYIWGGSPWPSPVFAKAGELARVSQQNWETVLAELRTVGWRTRNGRLYHPAVASVLNEARAFCTASQARTKAARAVRWPDNVAPDAPPPQTLSQTPLPPPNKVSKQYKQNFDKAVNPAERLTLSGGPPKVGDDREKEFLQELQRALQRYSPASAAAEMKNWGGWWRNRFRENPAKAQRVLADLATMVKERRINRNPGAAGLDLWNRLPD